MSIMLFPHCVGSKGELGVCKRRGRKEVSNACGALNVFLKELKDRKTNLSMDNEDVELSFIRTRLLREIPYGHIPDLMELTKITLKTIREDFGSAFNKTVDTRHSDYAFVTGIQIHGPEENFIAPVSTYAIVRGERKDVNLDKLQLVI